MSVDVSNLKEKLLPLWNNGPERCGLILLDGTIVEAKNLAEEAMEAYVMDPLTIIAYDDNIWGTWHTHNDLSGNLSAADYHNFQNYPDFHHFIIDRESVWHYYVEDGKVLLDD